MLNKNNRYTLATLIFAAWAIIAGSVKADIHPTAGINLPATSMTEVNDATALSTNPSNLSLLDSWNLVYAFTSLNNQNVLAGQGHGLFFAFPLGPFTIGTSTEFLRPTKHIKSWQGLDNRIRFSLGFSWDLLRVFSLSFVYRTMWYYKYGDINTFDLGLTIRPSNYLALSFLAQDVNTPLFGYKDSDTGQIETESDVRKFNSGLTLRPLGNDRLALGAELLYTYLKVKDGEEDKIYGYMNVSGILSAMIVEGLSFKGKFTVAGIEIDNAGDYIDKEYFIDASLVIDFPGFGIGVGGFGQVSPKKEADYLGTTFTASLHGDEAPSLNVPAFFRLARVAIISLDEKPDSFEFADILELLERARYDDSIEMLLIKPESSKLSWSQAEELQASLQSVKYAGKKTACYLTEISGPVYLACAGADNVYINPAGYINLKGLSAKMIFLRRMLDKIGIKADIVQIGKYKSAPETFTSTSPGKASLEQTERYFTKLYKKIIISIKNARSFNTAELTRKIIEKGPFTAKEAVANGLADSILGQDEIQMELSRIFGKRVLMDKKYGETPLRHRTYIDAPAIAVVHIEGDLIPGKSFRLPFGNIKLTGAETVTEQLRKLSRDDRIQAVILRINSPGGSALAADIIWKEIMALRETKYVIASLGPVAASGGYYIASAANEIFANSTTLTGSIGVFYGKADVSGLLDKIGIDVSVVKRGEYADADSWLRPFTKKERKRLERQLKEYYDLFTERVAAGRGRGFTQKIVHKLGQGRIWSGEDARHHLLVDKIGGLQDAIESARKSQNIPRNIKIFHIDRPRKNIFTRIARSLRSSSDNMTHLFSQMGANFVSTLKAAYPFIVSSSLTPRARLPYAIIQMD